MEDPLMTIWRPGSSFYPSPRMVCCPFFTFELVLELEGGQIRLRIRGLRVRRTSPRRLWRIELGNQRYRNSELEGVRQRQYGSYPKYRV